MNEGINFEIKEKEPDFEGLRVFMVRHGQSEYKELKGEIDDSVVDITEKGKEQINNTVEYLKTKIDKERDIVIFAHSPRKRAVDSMKIIYESLKNDGYDVVDDVKGREVRQRIDNARLLNKDNETINPGTNEYADAVWGVLEKEYERHGDNWFEEAWMKNENDRIKNDTYEMESYSEVKKRSKDHMAFLMRATKKLQPKFAEQGKRVVLIEVAHGENFGDFLEHATSGDNNMSNKEINNGGVLEMFIPISGQTIKSKIWTKDNGEEDLNNVKFDYLKRDFVD